MTGAEQERRNVEEVKATISEMTQGYEYRLSWECPSAACIIAHGNVAWESLTDDEWNGLPWERSYRIADGGDIHSQRHTLEQWAEDHLQPVRNVRFERRLQPNLDEGWDEVVRGATGITHWKTARGSSEEPA